MKNNYNLALSKFALECVQKIDDNIDKSKYKTLVLKMSTLIRNNGFINTIVFNLSKIANNNKVNEHNEVFKNIIMWSMDNYKLRTIFVDARRKSIDEIYTSKLTYNDYVNIIPKYIEIIAELNPVEYRLVSKEMINLFIWIKRFANGMIEGEN